MASHPVGSAVDIHSVEEYRGMRLYLSSDSRTGYAIKDGDELVSVFSGARGRGLDLVADAVGNGARRADCYAIPLYEGDEIGYLPRLYASAGLVEVARVEINPAYPSPEGSMWVSVLAKIDNPPPVKHFDKDGYDDALAYRDSLLENQS
jgi:hypothetical protein